jgi:hydroxymethylglutaryl-CoA lyase
MKTVSLVEVGPRDGFQPIVEFIPTKTKIEIIHMLYAAGIRRMEVSAFVSDVAVPQLADAQAVLGAAQELPGLNAQVLTPNRKHCDRALEAGARHIAFVLSASERHNQNNVRRTRSDSVREYERICEDLSDTVQLRLNVATAFDCPFDGVISATTVLQLLDELIPLHPSAELALCDTTGRATPDRVTLLFAEVQRRWPGLQVAFHGHDTYGLGVANVLAALSTGVTVIDASIAGLGGCPFAPGATGNVSTEDVVWTLENMGVSTGVDLEQLMNAANAAALIPGGLSGGRVRNALNASNKYCQGPPRA